MHRPPLGRGPRLRPRRWVATAAAASLLAGCGGATHLPPIVARTETGPAARVAPAIGVGGTPSAVAVGDGSVWVASQVNATVTRIDPASGAVVGPPIPVPTGPRALAVDASGVWVASGDGRVARIDPAASRVTGPPVAVNDPAGIAVGDGSVWVTDTAEATVTRLDETTGRPSGAPIRVGTAPTDLAVADGNVWVANSGDGTVSRINAARGQIEGAPLRITQHRPLNRGGGLPSIGQPGTEILALTAGDGAVWVAESGDPEVTRIGIVRIDPHQGQITSDAVEVPGAVPMRLAAGAGSVWVTDAGHPVAPGALRPPALLRLDPTRDALLGPPANIGPQPTSVATDPQGAWVTTAGDNSLRRVTPPR